MPAPVRIFKHLKRKERQVLGRTDLVEHEIDCSSAPVKIVGGTAKGSLKAVERIHRQERKTLLTGHGRYR